MNAVHSEPAEASWRRGLFAIALCVLAAACGPIRYDYEWAPYAITPARVKTGEALMAAGGLVSVIENHSATESRLLAAVGLGHYYGSHAQLADAIVTQLTEELELCNFSVKDDAGKSLRIKVTHSSAVMHFYRIRAHIRFQLEAGNGYVLKRSIGNSTPGSAGHGLDGAVALAVIEILNDPEIAAYLTSQASDP